MKTFAKSLLFALTVSALSVATVTAGTPAAGAPAAGTPDGRKSEGRAKHAPVRTTSPSAFRTASYPSTTSPVPVLNVLVEKPAGSRVSIRLVNKTGYTLVNQMLTKKEGKYSLKLNLADLEDGTYQVEVSDGNEVVVQEMTLATKRSRDAQRTIIL